MEVDVVAIDAAAEPMHDLRGAGGVFGGYVDGVDYGAAVHGAGRIGSMDGAAELQCERAMTGASFEDLDGRGGVSGGGCDVDVKEGDDGGCVEGVDLLLPNGAGVSPIGACEEDERGPRTGVTNRRTLVTYSSIVGKVTQYCAPALEVTSFRVLCPMMSVCRILPRWVSTFFEGFNAVLRIVVALSFNRRSSTISPSAPRALDIDRGLLVGGSN